MKKALILAAGILAGCVYNPPQPAVPLTNGMTTGSLIANYGNPVRVNRDSTGSEQWVFRQMCQVGPLFQDTLYVYVQANQVTGWQKLGCYY